MDKIRSTGLYAEITAFPTPDCNSIMDKQCMELEKKNWYRSSERIIGFNPYGGQVANKKWPLKKVSKILIDTFLTITAKFL